MAVENRRITSTGGLRARRAGRNLFSLFLVALLVVGMFAPAGVITANAAEETTMKVYKGHSRDATPFYVVNMFPGDSVQDRYNVELSYKGKLTLHFTADVRPGFEKLAEVLMCSITVSGQTLYQGLLRDMPEQLDHPVFSDRRTTEVVPYDISVWLETSVGNEYMNQELIRDFLWWVDVPDHPDKPDRPDKPTRPSGDTGSLELPKTGDQIMLWVVILCASSALLAVLFYRKRKEEKRDAGEK